MKFSSIQQLVALLCCLLIHTTFSEINRDLELDKLCITIDHTQTIYGNYTLKSLLAQPITNQQILENRQAAIGYIAQNTPMHEQLDALLQAFNKQESYIEQIMQPESALENAALADFYFSSSYFKQWNYSPACLELGCVAHFGNLCSSMVQHALAFAIFTWGLNEEHTCAIHPPKKHKHKDHNHDHHHHHKHDHHETCNHPSHAHATPTGFKALLQSKEFRYAFQLWHGIAQIQELYSVQAIVRSEMQCIKQLQIQLMGVARGFHVIQRIRTLLKNHPELISTLTHYQDLENICTAHNISKKLHHLLTLLQMPTFKGEASVFSRIGIILAAYKLAKEIGHELKPALDAIGEIDAYASCAQLFNEHKSSPYQYSFARYTTNSATPYLSAHNFWHPLVSTNNIQLNSISLGAHNTPRNIILTGPNACGKSTNIKALMLCAYLAQTITLVPAEQYSQTIYKEIYSSMVVADNIEKDMSLFVTELTNAEELLTRVENLAKNEYMFIALDELFKSTHHERGQLIAQQLLEKLYESSQVITLVSTHFEELSELAHTSNGTCVNYTVNNFILEPGIGSSGHSFDIVKAQTRSRLLH